MNISSFHRLWSTYIEHDMSLDGSFEINESLDEKMDQEKVKKRSERLYKLRFELGHTK